jgi:tRNA 2-selenouridine synthase
MAIQRVSITEFLTLAENFPVLDVRSPGEFAHAHIPGAHSLPLFTDEERKVVGTAYKQQSKQVAVKIGLKYFGVKMVEMVEQVEKLVKSLQPKSKTTDSSTTENQTSTVLVHCWRGGMRSAGVAWLLDLYGFKVYTLAGGYKGYRNWVLEQFDKEYPMHILGGYTGSGKTEVLKALLKRNYTVIDLEGIAHHKGSAFGAMGLPAQPSQEQFENILAGELVSGLAQSVSDESLDFQRSIWLEDESQRIGMVNIPSVLFQQMRKKKVFFLEIPFESRLDYINLHYGKFVKSELVNAVIRIKKRLGGLETKTAMNFLLEDDTKEAFRILLQYYDKLYGKNLENNRENIAQTITKLICDDVNDLANAEKIHSINKPSLDEPPT